MMAGCQVGRDPSMLATYNYNIISIIVNTIQRKKERKHNIITPLHIYNRELQIR